MDQISAKFLKDGAPVIAIHLDNLINTSIKLDTLCKIVKIKLLFKKWIKTDPKNYRPIPFLPLILKVIEKSIHDQKKDYLQRNEMIYIYHSSFRANHSTDICLSDA